MFLISDRSTSAPERRTIFPVAEKVMPENTTLSLGPIPSD